MRTVEETSSVKHSLVVKCGATITCYLRQIVGCFSIEFKRDVRPPVRTLALLLGDDSSDRHRCAYMQRIRGVYRLKGSRRTRKVERDGAASGIDEMPSAIVEQRRVGRNSKVCTFGKRIPMLSRVC